MSIEEVVEKIRKLINLSKSSNVGEAAAAAAGAQRLMLAYKIEMGQVEIAQEEAEPIIAEDVLKIRGTKTATSWQKVLLYGVAKNNFCRTVNYPSRQGGSRDGSTLPGKLEIYGKKSDVTTALYLYNVLLNEIDRLADEWGNWNGAGRGEKGSFRLGAADEISKRLRVDRERQLQEVATNNSTAMVRINKNQAEVDLWFDNKFTNLRKAATIQISDVSGYRSGQAAGKSVSLGNNGRSALGTPQKSLR